jgi:predicted permease
LGANAAIFSVVDAVLLRSLPFQNADRLVAVWEDTSHFGFPLAPLAPANSVDWKHRNHVFEDVAALKGDVYALTGAGAPEQVERSPVTANLFPLLGVSPILGRSFSPEEDRSGGPRVVLIGYGLWQRRFGGDPSTVGSEIWLNNEKYAVVGVMPRGITFPEKSQIWIPLALSPRELAERDNHYLRVFARLKPGVTLARAQREMADLAGQSAREYPATNMDIGAMVVSLRDQLVGYLKSTLWAVTAGVGCVLLIACANLAGLLLTRGVGRERDFAVRAALGAGRARLIRQTLIESLLLAGFGCGSGILIALLTMPFCVIWCRVRSAPGRSRGSTCHCSGSCCSFRCWPQSCLEPLLAACPFQRIAAGRPCRVQRQHTGTGDAYREQSGASGRAPGRGGITDQNALGPRACTAKIPTRRSDDAEDLASRLGEFTIPYLSGSVGVLPARAGSGERHSRHCLGWIHNLPAAHQFRRHESLHR